MMFHHYFLQTHWEIVHFKTFGLSSCLNLYNLSTRLGKKLLYIVFNDIIYSHLLLHIPCCVSKASARWNITTRLPISTTSVCSKPPRKTCDIICQVDAKIN